MKRSILTCLSILLAATVFLAGCEPSFTSLHSDLLSNDPAKVTKATRLLAKRPSAMPNMASALAISDDKIRARYYEVIRQAGPLAIDAMVHNISYMRLSDKHRSIFRNFFITQGAPAFDALTAYYGEKSDTLAEGIARDDFSATVLENYQRMEDLAKVLFSFRKVEGSLDVLVQRLRHPHADARLLTARLLCHLGWTPGDWNSTEAHIFASHLVGAGCPGAAIAEAQIVALARSDLAAYLALEKEYPAPAGAKYYVLAEAGTDEVIDTIVKECEKTDNGFLVNAYLQVLEIIGNEKAQQARKQILDTFQKMRAPQSK